MARGGLSWEGVGAVYATYQAAGSISAVMLASGVTAVEGKAVALEGDGKVGFGSAGDRVHGKLDKYESDHYLTVQVGGYTTLPGVSGNLPTTGDILTVNGSGSVQPSTGATGRAEAVSVDTTNRQAVVFLG